MIGVSFFILDDRCIVLYSTVKSLNYICYDSHCTLLYMLIRFFYED